MRDWKQDPNALRVVNHPRLSILNSLHGYSDTVASLLLIVTLFSTSQYVTVTGIESILLTVALR